MKWDELLKLWSDVVCMNKPDNKIQVTIICEKNTCFISAL